jgi:hypothetical protein
VEFRETPDAVCDAASLRRRHHADPKGGSGGADDRIDRGYDHQTGCDDHALAMTTPTHPLMAKRKLGITLLLATAIGGTAYGALQESNANDLQERVDKLETRLAKMENYVQAQASSLRSFGTSLDAAVKKGFTAGINFDSRKILVRAWRKIVDAAAETTTGTPKGKR